MSTYTVAYFTAELQRERGKRQATYPKIFEKALKKEQKICEIEGRSKEETDSRIMLENIKLTTKQRIQFELLEDAMRAMANPGAEVILSVQHASAVHSELLRELKMRKKCYPRWVYFKRMDALAAEELIRLWTALCEYWKDHFVKKFETPAPEPKKEEQP